MDFVSLLQPSAICMWKFKSISMLHLLSSTVRRDEQPLLLRLEFFFMKMCDAVIKSNLVMR